MENVQNGKIGFCTDEKYMSFFLSFYKDFQYKKINIAKKQNKKKSNNLK